MSKAPKLHTNKPKKDQIKKYPSLNNTKPKNFSSPLLSSTASSESSKMATPPPPPPQPSLPKESFARRYKFVWPMLLAVNLSVGAYLFMRTKKKDTDITQEVAPSATSDSTLPSTTAVTLLPETKETPPSPPAILPAKSLDPIPESRQRELFKWILEEKRKIKPQNAEEKKRLEEEKAILKQFIRAKSIPSL